MREAISPNIKRVLVLGAYGLIGFSVVRQLQAAGIDVVGLGRSPRTAARVLPNLEWRFADLGELTTPDMWDDYLRDVEAVVNCSGTLQDGPDDDLEDIHHHMPAALAQACVPRAINLVQISAIGVTPEASTVFLASKARGDAAIRTSGVRYTILRPGLVLSSSAYGGTALLRMLAAVPYVQPIAMPDAQVQTVDVNDVAQAVASALQGNLPPDFEADLVEQTSHSLTDLVAAMRGWLGFAPAKAIIKSPNNLAQLVAWGADKLGYLGWRSPLRSTAIKVLNDGVLGDPTIWQTPLKSLDETLAANPARVEDRLHARMTLLLPFLIAALAIFWGLSGLIGLIKISDAALVLERAGWSTALALISVAFWSVIDLALAAAILIRRTAKTACLAMIVVSMFYLASSSIVAPWLWLDPLGPMVKVIPSIMLALVTYVALDNR